MCMQVMQLQLGGGEGSIGLTAVAAKLQSVQCAVVQTSLQHDLTSRASTGCHSFTAGQDCASPAVILM